MRPLETTPHIPPHPRVQSLEVVEHPIKRRLVARPEDVRQGRGDLVDQTRRPLDEVGGGRSERRAGKMGGGREECVGWGDGSGRVVGGGGRAEDGGGEGWVGDVVVRE